MKVLITTGMVIVFISTFFVFFIAERLIYPSINCHAETTRALCLTGNVPMISVGMILAGLFVLIDMMVVYILVSTVTSKRAICFGSFWGLFK